jgi:hypothetical protein
MKAFSVSINGKRIALAGLGGEGVLSVMVDLSSQEHVDRLNMEIGGLIGSTGEQVIWPSPAIAVGDKIVIEIVEADAVDEPMD